MKKLFFIMIATLLSATLFAQSEKYVKAMENLVPSVDTTRNQTGLTELAGSFERIANAEKTQWLPYYYAALCYIDIANDQYSKGQTDGIDALLDKADPLLKKADELEKNNSEIYCAIKMLNSGRMMVDPMNRYMTYMGPAADALATAKKLDPQNPRVSLLEGMDKFFIPEQYGGSKAEAKILFEDAMKKYAAFKPASSIHPTWGKVETQYFLSQAGN